MSIYKIRQLASVRTPDDTQLYVVRRDLSGGVNSRQHGSLIGENQVTVLYNADIGTAGQSSKRPGSTLIANDVSNNTFAALHNYERQGYSDSLIAYDDTVLWEWLGTGNWVATGVGTFTAAQTDVAILQCKESGLVPDDVFIVQNGTDNAQRFHKDSSDVWAVEDLGSISYYSMPKSTVMCWYGNRVWVLLNDLLCYSDAYPASYTPDSAIITGDITTFTGTTDDKLKVTIDDVVYDDINISASTSIDNVVTAINGAVGSTVASNVGGYLVITSTTKGGISNVTIADGTNIGVTAAVITGDKNSFTGTAGDTLNLGIDSVWYYNIDIASSTSINNVVTAINGAVGSTVASNVGGYLVITSPITKVTNDDDTITVTSNVTIADGWATTQTVIAKLFSVVADRTDTGTVNTVVDRLFSDDGLEDKTALRTDSGNTPFDTVSNTFRIPVGAERGIVPTRDTGMVILGEDAIWGLAPSATPAVTDKPQPLVTDHGVVSKKGWLNIGDDIYYFSQDGFRALKRTIQDKLSTGQTVPLSYYLKDEYDRISWGYIDRLTMEYFDNKIFISVPTSATTFDTWVYYPSSQSFVIIQGWSPRCWETYKISGKEYLYYAIHGNGAVYRAWYGYTDEGATTTTGTAINYQEEGRKEDLGQPLVKKVGGVLKIKALSSGNYNVTIYASIDDQSYTTLGTINLKGNAPTLPINLPFTLASGNITQEEFPLDSLGEFYQIRIKIQHNAVNGSDPITILEREIISYAQAFQEGS